MKIADKVVTWVREIRKACNGKDSQDKLENGRKEGSLNPCNKVDKLKWCRMSAGMNH